MPGAVVSAGASITGNVVVPTSVQGSWVTIHASLTATAEAAATLLRPLLSTTSSSAYPAKISPGVGKYLIRAYYPQASTITTSPVVRLYAIFGEPNTSGVFADDGTVRWMRIDNSNSGAAGLTVTLNATTNGRDTTYKYSDPVSLSAQDVFGAKYVLALVETAAVISAGECVLEMLALN